MAMTSGASGASAASRPRRLRRTGGHKEGAGGGVGMVDDTVRMLWEIGGHHARRNLNGT